MAESCSHTRLTLRGPCPKCGAVFDGDGEQVFDSHEEWRLTDLSDDELCGDWHRWNDYLAELNRSGLESRTATKTRDEIEAELDRRGILVPGKRA